MSRKGDWPVTQRPRHELAEAYLKGYVFVYPGRPHGSATGEVALITGWPVGTWPDGLILDWKEHDIYLRWDNSLVFGNPEDPGSWQEVEWI